MGTSDSREIGKPGFNSIPSLLRSCGLLSSDLRFCVVPCLMLFFSRSSLSSNCNTVSLVNEHRTLRQLTLTFSMVTSLMLLCGCSLLGSDCGTVNFCTEKSSKTQRETNFATQYGEEIFSPRNRTHPRCCPGARTHPVPEDHGAGFPLL